jgi:mRNA interferase MazF
VLLASESGLPRDSVINVSQIITLDKTFLDKQVGSLTERILQTLDDGIRLVLDI